MIHAALLGLLVAAAPAPELDGSLPPIPEKFRRFGPRETKVAWAVADAPYRAVVTVGSPATMPGAGMFIEIAEFGATMPELADVVLLNAAGEAQPLVRLWRGEGKRALLLSPDLDPKQVYYLYFGGGKKRISPAWQPSCAGLLLETRRLGASSGFQGFNEVNGAWQNAATEGMGFVTQIHHGLNPYGESVGFLSRFSGYLITKGLKEITLFTQSSDASFVLVNGQLALAWPGIHGAVANAKNVPQRTVPCGDPVTRIDYLHAKAKDATTQPVMLLGWVQGKEYKVIPSDSWVHSGEGNVIRYEEREGRPVPVPVVSFSSYIGYENCWYYETAFSCPSLPSDWTAEWMFDDGAKRTGTSFQRILPSCAPRKVALRLKRGQETVTGFRWFRPPDGLGAASINHGGDTARYAEALGLEDPAGMTTEILRQAAFFLSQFGTIQQGARIAEGYIKACKDQKDPVLADSHLLRLRALAQTNPSQAIAELRMVPAPVRQVRLALFDQLEADILVFCQRDPSAVGRVEQLAMQSRDAETARLMRVRIGDAHRVAGRLSEAVEAYRRAQGSFADPTQGRKLPAQNQAFSLSVAEALDNSQLELAGRHLIEWELTCPLAKLDSDQLVQRARWLNAQGRWRESSVELESFKSISPESPYIVDAEFYRAVALRELGSKDEARRIWSDLATKFPKHSLAERCREAANQP